MRIKNFTLIALVSLAGSALLQSSDATVPVPADGDLFMGFHSITATNEYLWDIGQYSQFDGKSVGYSVSLGNIGTDLSSVSLFGANWATDINIQWGSVGQLSNSTAGATLFATRATLTPWAELSGSSQNFTESTIQTMEFSDFFGQDNTANNPNATIHSTAGNSWASYNNGANSAGSSFLTWVPTVEAPETPNSGSGIATTSLDLFKIVPDSSGSQPPSVYIGTFTIDTLGNVKFQVLAPLPTVTMQATDASASEVPSTDTGTVQITRTGATTSALTVIYAISGTAKNGTDYTKLRGQASIKRGASSVNVVIQPIDDTLHERDETAILTLSPNSGYTVGSPNTGTVVIHSNE